MTEAVFEVNLFAVADLVRAALPALRDVAAVVRTVVDLPPGGTVESVSIRPTRRR